MAYVLSSVSGNLISAASAGFAPTNSADVSAIASAYQVVSATATQLNAGSAYVTSINDTPISAARAGNAANASMANSAYYDGTGRLISALPDSATVSSIASSYAESAASSKQDTLTFSYDDTKISAINGSALAGGGTPIVVTGTAWDPDTSAWVYNLTSNLSAAERHVWTFQNGYKWDYIEYLKDDSGKRFPMMAYFLAAGAEQMYNGGVNGNGRLQFSPSQSMFSADGSNKYGLSPLTYATGASMNLSAGYFRASYRGDTIFISRGPSGTIDSSNSAQIKAVRIEAHNNRGSNISAYDATTTGYYGSTGMKLGRSGVFVDDSGNSSNTAASATLTTGSLTFYRAGSSDVMRQSSIPYWNAKLDSSAIECDTASVITAIGGSSIGGGVDEATVSAIASAYQVVSSVGDDGTYITSVNGSALSGVGGGGGVDSATVSAIASAYAESSVSSVSGDYYSTSNPSGFITQGDMFPYVIKSGTSERAVITPTFQDNNINRPTLMVSGYKSSNGKWPRMMVTDYNGSTGYTHSGVLLANAYETYIGTAIAGESGVKTFRMDEYSMDFLPFRVWNTSTQSWHTADLERGYYHTAKYSRLGVTLSALENSGENELFNQFLNSGIYMSSTDYAYLDTADTASGMSATASASAEINIDSINRWNGKQDTLSFGYDSDKISAINGSALAGEAQVVSAVGTETAYTPDGVSDVVTSINGNYISALSADSAFQASYDENGRELTSLASEYEISSIASSYAESAVSGKADSSALSSYALSADVSGTVDLVSTQSANWGGSALALSAGPGVKLEKVGDTLVAGLDGAMINEETIAGIWNGKLVYQMLLSGTGQTPGTSNIALPASLTGTSIESKWLDPSDSYILYGNASNCLPMSWCLGDGRYGALNIIGSNVTMRSTDNGTNNCSAYFKVKYIKAEA
jgi:hypothetical protein